MFLGSDALRIQRERHSDMALLFLWQGIAREVAGDMADALHNYDRAAQLDTRAPLGLRRTRGVGWQAAYRGSHMLSPDLAQRKSWCAAMSSLLLQEARLSAN